MQRRSSNAQGSNRSRTGKFERYALTQEPRGHVNYLLVCPATRNAVLIDAAGSADQIARAVADRRAHVRMIVLTHGHAGHWSALGQLRDILHVPVGIHLDDADMLPLSPNFALAHNQRLAFGTSELYVIHTPGHTPGSVSFIGDANLFTGDTLMRETPGTTAPPLGDPAALMRSLHEEIFTLPDLTSVFPGHGEPTSLAAQQLLLPAWDYRQAGG